MAESLLTSAVERNPKSIPGVTSLAMLVQHDGTDRGGHRVEPQGP